MFRLIKNFFRPAVFVLGLGVFCSSLIGCAKKDVEVKDVECSERFPVCVTLPGLMPIPNAPDAMTAQNAAGAMPLSKVTVVGGEDNISSVQVFVFRKDGVLDAYAKSATSPATLDCTVGEKDFIVLVNAPDITNVGTKTELEALRSSLLDNGVSNFVMTGKANAVITASQNSVAVDVSRLVARVTIKKITNAITAPQLSSAALELKQIYLSNVAGDIAYGGIGEPLVWYNKIDISSDVPALLSSGVLAESIANNTSYTTAHHFYCYPNHTQKDSSEPVWSPRFTRLVLKVGIRGKDYYYPVTLSAIDANTIYNVEEVKITRLGSVSPDIPVSVGTVSLTINVLPWQVGPSSNIVI